MVFDFHQFKSRVMARLNAPFTSSIDGHLSPRSCLRLVTGFWRPQGTMRLKWSRLVVTFTARPWSVTQRRTRTPMAAILEECRLENEECRMGGVEAESV